MKKMTADTLHEKDKNIPAVSFGTENAAPPVSEGKSPPCNTEIRFVDPCAAWTDSNMKGIAVLSGRMISENLTHAKELIISHRKNKARERLVSCIQITEGLLKMMPSITVADEILDLKNALADSAGDIPSSLWLPVRTSLHEMSFYATEIAQAAKDGLAHAKDISGTNPEEAERTLEAVADAIRASTAYMPVKKLSDMAYTALKALSGMTESVIAATITVEEALAIISDVNGRLQN